MVHVYLRIHRRDQILLADEIEAPLLIRLHLGEEVVGCDWKQGEIEWN